MNDPILATLKAERKRRGWTQQHLGEQLGRRSYQTVWQWENGSNEPGLSNLRAWAAALDYDVVLMPRIRTEPTRED